jgi:hypothetical protein
MIYNQRKQPEKFIPLTIIPIYKDNLEEAISWKLPMKNYDGL